MASTKGRAATSGTRRGNGAGWGGPAQGPGHGGPARGGPAKGSFMLYGPATGMGVPGWSRMTRKEKAELKERRATAAEDRLYHLVLHAQHEETQLHACARLHAIINGKPLAPTITTRDAIAEMSADEIRSELARLDSEAAAVAGPRGVSGSAATPSDRLVALTTGVSRARRGG